MNASIIVHKIAKFNYFAKQIIYLAFPGQLLENTIYSTSIFKSCIQTKKLSCLRSDVEFDMNGIFYEFKKLHHF